MRAIIDDICGAHLNLQKETEKKKPKKPECLAVHTLMVAQYAEVKQKIFSQTQ